MTASRPDGVAGDPSAVAALLVDAEGMIRSVGGSVAELVGHDPDALGGTALTELVAADDRHVLAGAIAGVTVGGTDGRTPLHVVDSMGLERPLVATACLLRGDGDLVVIALMADHAGAGTADVLAGLGFLRDDRDATMVCALDGTVTYASDAVTRVIGIRPEDLLGRRPMEQLTDEDRAQVIEAFDAAVAEPGETHAVSFRIGRADGGWRRVRAELTHCAEQVAIDGVVIRFQDVTERVEADEAIRASERRFRKLVQKSSDILIVVGLDGRIRWISPAVTRILGYSPEALVGLPSESMLHPHDVARAGGHSRAVRAGDAHAAPVVVRARHAEGGWRHLSLSGADLSDDNDVSGLLFNAHDVSAEVEAERGRERLSLVLEASTDLVGMTVRGNDLIRFNRAGRDVLGLEGTELTSVDTLVARTPPWVRHRFTSEVLPTLETSGLWEGELAVHDIDGDLCPLSVVMIALREPDGAIETLAVVARDISERKAFEDQLEHQATHDPLTGLPNRTLLLDRLRVAVGRAGRQSTVTAVLFLDLDNFKLINDSLGHSAGDVLLVQVAQRIESAVRPGDTVARFGGDEFAVLCEDLDDRVEALTIAARIEEAVGGALSIEGTEVMVTVSIGVASSDGDQEAESLVRDSDAAMYQAKARGRSRTEVFDSDMHVQAIDRLELETALRRSLDRHELRVAYQPQVDLRTGRINGVEALLRWEHPERGIMLPGEFLHIAEETGLIVPIGNWITAAACRAVTRLHDLVPDAGDLVMSVNLSARQLASPRLLDDVAAIVVDAGLTPRALMLEITETDLMDIDASGEALTRLHELGVGIAVDDFGTGWSSLRYLRHFPVDVLKVDRSFVNGLGRDTEDEAIVAAVVDLAHALGLQSVAEGVEHQVHLDRLRALGCDSAQGWLLGMPMAEADLVELLGRPG